MKNKKVSVLVTGGAGFIGSNIVSALLELDQVQKVRVLDNLSTGNKNNLEKYSSNQKFEFLWGDIRSYNTCLEACDGIDLVSHQAALGSVPRSIKSPIVTNDVNITGTLNIFTAAKNTGINRVVYAASSSTYGDSLILPKKEEVIGSPISPYAVTKLVNELYAKVYSDIYNIDFIGLRYFNVYGPHQSPNGAYAAVIPLFMNALLKNKKPTINGDGMQTRDFTYVENVVQANIKSLFTTNEEALNQVYNIACGESISILDLYNEIKKITDSNIEPNFGPTREGDVKHSLANISKAKNLLSYCPKVKTSVGIIKTYEWFKENYDVRMKPINF